MEPTTINLFAIFCIFLYNIEQEIKMKTDYAFINWAMDVVAKNWSVISNEKTSENFSDESIRITQELIERLKTI